jgi:hypothetical protein
MSTFEILDEEWASDLQNSLDQYMNELRDAVYSDGGYTLDEDGYMEFDHDLNTESGIAYCGCNVCETREMLAFATPRIIEGYLAGKVNLIKE